MVFSRNKDAFQRGLQEVITKSAQSATRRICELPSLRYGSIGAKSVTSGPLRVGSNCYDVTLPRSKSKPSFNSYPDSLDPPIRPPRRVRFTLPAVEDDTSVNYGSGDAVESTAGDAPFRTRASQRFGVARSNTAPIQQVTPDVNGLTNTPESKSQPSSGEVLISNSPGVRIRVHPTGRYIRGTLSPTSNAVPHAAATLGGQELLRAARDGDDKALRDLLRRAVLVGIPEGDLNAVDSSGRTIFSYVASNGPVELLEKILEIPGLDSNKPDNEGNTPLHFAAQAGQVECLSCILSKCTGIEIDARNNLGFTPLMKAALQGRNKCAKLLLFAGANPTLRDNGRGFRADQWARFCGRYVCADVIEKHARQRLLERSTSYGNWGGENELGARVLLGKVVPVPPIQTQTSHGIKSKLRKVFRTSSGPNHSDHSSSARLVTQLTSAALCASTPVLPTASNVPPVVKSLIRPLTVPRLQITLVNNTTNSFTESPTSSYTSTTSELCKDVSSTAISSTVDQNTPKSTQVKKKK